MISTFRGDKFFASISEKIIKGLYWNAVTVIFSFVFGKCLLLLETDFCKTFFWMWILNYSVLWHLIFSITCILWLYITNVLLMNVEYEFFYVSSKCYNTLIFRLLWLVWVALVLDIFYFERKKFRKYLVVSNKVTTFATA